MATSNRLPPPFATRWTGPTGSPGPSSARPLPPAHTRPKLPLPPTAKDVPPHTMPRTIAATLYKRLPPWCQRRIVDALAVAARIAAVRRRIVHRREATVERAAELAAGDPVLRDVLRAHVLHRRLAHVEAAGLLAPLVETGRLVHEDHVVLIKSLMAEGRIDECRRPFEKACSWARRRNASPRVSREIALLAIGLDDADAAVEFSRRAKDDWLRQYTAILYGTGAPVTEPALADRRPAGERNTNAVALGLLDYRTPAGSFAQNLGDYFQTLAVMRHLARFHEPGAFRCDERLDAVLRHLARSWTADDRLRAGGRVDVDLVVVDRDCVRWRGDLWLPFFGWCHPHPGWTEGIPLTFPLPAHVRPLFFSFHLQDIRSLTPGLCEHLKRHEPIGCRDRTTRDRLASAGVKAFFSGCVTSTLELPGDAPGGEGGAFFQVDDAAEPIAGATRISHITDPDGKPFAQRMVDTLKALRVYKRARGVGTSRLHCYLPCRAMGTPVAFHPEDPSDERFDGLVGIGDDEFRAMGDGLTGLMAKVFRPILAGADAGTVYRTWREATLPLVARDEIERRAYPRLFAKAPKPDGEPEARPAERVRIAFAFDRNLVAYVPNVVRSIEANTSHGTTYHLLTRGLTNADRDALQHACPDAEIQWHAMDGWLGKAGGDGLVRHTTVSAMDRCALPDLLPRIDRIVYLDVDLIVLGDVGELYAWPLGDSPIGAVTVFRLGVWLESSPRHSTQGRERAEQMRHLRAAASVAGPLQGPAFNAGVLLMSLEAMRRDGFAAQAKENFEAFGYDDQTLLNCYAGGDYAELPRAWNVVYTNHFGVDAGSAKIVHWAGSSKPWHDDANDDHAMARTRRLWERYSA